MSQTLLLSGADRISSSILNIHYPPESTHQQHAPVDHLSHLSSKHSLWNPQSSSLMDNAQSFTARRPAATNLPQFQLPPPDHLQKSFPAYAPSAPPAVVNSVLTPPAGLPNDLSPLASSVNSNGSTASSNSGPSYTPQNPMGYWPTPQSHASYTYSSAPPLASPYAQNYMGRGLYSPSQYPNRNASAPSANEALSPPPYEMSQLPPFPTNMSSGGGSQQQSSLPNISSQQQRQQQPQPMSNNGMMNSQQQTSQAPQQSPLHAADGYGVRAPPTPSYYTPSSTPQQPSFPAYTQQSPTQQSPNSSGPPQNRISPPMQPPQSYRPYTNGYSLPAMSGPILSNVHNPGSQMALVGGNMQQMQYAPHNMSGQVYGHHQAPQNDRPFKCDQCPQSFNRNHDLKRHKRIHLAVKPFPCTHCEKSFSRRDALKRHILVKNCGNKPGAGGSTTNGNSQSPIDRSEVMSDSTDDTSPQMLKKEL